MVLTGVLYNIFPEKSFGNFRVTKVWLKEQTSQRPNVWEVDFCNDDGAWLKKFSTGQLVNINIAVLGKMSNKMTASGNQEFVYNSLRGIKIQLIK